jgi:hypothetical protein
MEEKIKDLEKDILLIKQRNDRVQADKAWETSKIRMVSILVLTYVFASLALYLMGVQNFLLSAIIPVLGYFLSTLSLPFIKKWWITRLHLENSEHY